jgi:hypothetical protein
LKISLFVPRRTRKSKSGFFSIVDVCGVLTASDYQSARNYWKALKFRLKDEGSQLVTKCNQLKMKSTDGKYYNTDVADTEQILRLIQSIGMVFILKTKRSAPIAKKRQGSNRPAQHTCHPRRVRGIAPWIVRG